MHSDIDIIDLTLPNINLKDAGIARQQAMIQTLEEHPVWMECRFSKTVGELIYFCSRLVIYGISYGVCRDLLIRKGKDISKDNNYGKGK